MQKTRERVTLKGNPVGLAGNEINVGDEAPDFTAVANDLSAVRLSDFRGKAILLSSVVSLDTPVCDLETHQFNAEVGKLGKDAVCLTLSMDLPFAQKRWCGAGGAENVRALSDHRDGSFGEAYGVLMSDLRLLARAIFVIDRRGVVRYKELVKEVTSDPDYEAALSAVRKALRE